MPKAAQITHRNYLSFLNDFTPILYCSRHDNCIVLGRPYFDMIMLEGVFPILSECRIYVYTHSYDWKVFGETLEKYKINCMTSVPVVLRQVFSDEEIFNHYDLSSLNMINIGAERPEMQLLESIGKSIGNISFLNTYGPTEGTICCYSYRIDGENLKKYTSFPIGFPFEGIESKLVEVEEGFYELYLGGSQVMLGYLDNELENLRASKNFDGSRFYGTGDIFKVSVKKGLEFCGRRDDEVKIKGYRVNLAEIKYNLEVVMGFNFTVPHLITNEEKSILSICIVEREEVDKDQIVDRLKELLPFYMIPDQIYHTKEAKRLPNGKLIWLH